MSIYVDSWQIKAPGVYHCIKTIIENQMSKTKSLGWSWNISMYRYIFRRKLHHRPKITWDSWEVDMRAEDNRQEGNLEPDWVGGSHRAVHMLVGMDIQLVEELPDWNVTSAGLLVLPLVVVQTCHLFYPFQSCAASKLQTNTITMSLKPYNCNLYSYVLLLRVYILW